MFFFSSVLIILLISPYFKFSLMCQTGKYGLRIFDLHGISSPLERPHPTHSSGLHNPAQHIPIFSSGKFMQLSLNYGSLT